MRISTRHVSAGLTCVVALATLTSPAWAGHPNDQAGMFGVGAIAAGTERESVRPDDRGIARGPGSLSIPAQTISAVRPDDRGEARGPGGISTPTTVSAPTTFDDGFPWAEVSMGAALFVLLGLVGSALVLNGRYHRRPA